MIDVLRDFPTFTSEDALRAAMAVGGEIYAGPPMSGIYPLDLGTLYWDRNTHLILDNRTTIKRTTAIGMIRNRFPDDDFGRYTGRGNLHVSGGGTFDVNGSDINGVTGDPASAFTIAHADKVTIEGITIKDTPGYHGIDLIGVRNARIDNVRMLGFRDTGNRSFSGGIQIDGTYGAYSGDSLPSDKTPCNDVKITRCLWNGSGTQNMTSWAAGVESHGYEEDVNGFEHYNISVVNNTFMNLTYAAVRGWHWRKSRIAQNFTQGMGITLQNSFDSVVSNNDVYSAKNTGVWINASCEDIYVLENIIKGAGLSTPDTHFGIRASGGVTRITVRNNTVSKENSGASAKMKHAMSFQNTVSGLSRSGNRLSGSIGAALDDQSVSPVTTVY